MTQFPEQTNGCMPESDFPTDSHAGLPEIDVEIDPDLILDFLNWLIDLSDMSSDYGYCDQ
ncbi:MAG TPA: hypothetical protein VHL11_05905 [Phototrophicaceae bacterium]|nr:hypothetical protein [Phototrophicaceae bacterium]